jgi:hypothetical protein
MKQTILRTFFGAVLCSFAFLANAQGIPTFQNGAYQVREGSSHTKFSWATTNSDFEAAQTTWLGCGPNVRVNHQIIDGVYHIELIIGEQTGPEYVVKLLSVAGFSQYQILSNTKEISSLEADLQLP